MSEVKAISVTQLARRIRNLLEIQVGEIWEEGEVSNVRKQWQECPSDADLVSQQKTLLGVVRFVEVRAASLSLSL